MNPKSVTFVHRADITKVKDVEAAKLGAVM